jgi:hypothetical protein
MTGSTFRIHVVITIGLLLSCTSILLGCAIYFHSAAEDLRAGVPALVAAAAGWITYCLQRRVSYINSLRDLWEKVVEAVQTAYQYTYKPTCQEADLVQVIQKLSCCIDDVRGVFRNVEEIYVLPSALSKEYVMSIKKSTSMQEIININGSFKLDRTHIGVYPFESLKQIRATIIKLGHGDLVTQVNATAARRAIDNLWKIMRYELSKELDRDYPAFPDTPYDPGAGIWRKVRRAIGFSPHPRKQLSKGVRVTSPKSPRLSELQIGPNENREVTDIENNLQADSEQAFRARPEVDQHFPQQDSPSTAAVASVRIG